MPATMRATNTSPELTPAAAGVARRMNIVEFGGRYIPPDTGVSRYEGGGAGRGPAVLLHPGDGHGSHRCGIASGGTGHETDGRRTCR